MSLCFELLHKFFYMAATGEPAHKFSKPRHIFIRSDSILGKRLIIIYLHIQSSRKHKLWASLVEFSPYYLSVVSTFSILHLLTMHMAQLCTCNKIRTYFDRERYSIISVLFGMFLWFPDIQTYNLEILSTRDVMIESFSTFKHPQNWCLNRSSK